ncbi:hypothetical protein ACLOJK_022254 [Asimina triloba]
MCALWPHHQKSSVIVVAVAYAIMVTRSINLNWKMRAVRVLPMFVLPALSSAIYLTLVSLTRMPAVADAYTETTDMPTISHWKILGLNIPKRDDSSRFKKDGNHKDQKALERLCAERQAGVDELKEKTNYYMTQQLIQKYDPDPAAKAAAARVLSSKLGTESGLKVHLEDESNFTVPHGKSNDAELVQSRGLQNRKQSLSKHGSTRNSEMQQLVKEMSSNDGHDENPKLSTDDQAVIVENHPRSVVNEGGWFARIAALLVGEDPTQCYALVCGNCHTHNGELPERLARKEDFPFITYYCPHCHALNKSREVEDHGPISPAGDPRSNARGEEVNETRRTIHSGCGACITGDDYQRGRVVGSLARTKESLPRVGHASRLLLSAPDWYAYVSGGREESTWTDEYDPKAKLIRLVAVLVVDIDLDLRRWE